MRKANLAAPVLGLVLLAAAGRAAPAASVQSRLEKGYLLAEEKKNTEAISAFSSVLKTEPDNHAALVALGYLYSGVKQWKSAVKNFKAAASQDPADQRLRMDYAYALQGEGDLDAASVEFASLAGQQGEFQAAARVALESAQTASSAKPADSKVRGLLERGYAALSRGDKASARTQFEAALKLDSANTAALKQLGFLNFDAGRLLAAAGNFEAARAVEPDDYLTALQLGYTYAKLRKGEEAREAFTAASASSDAKIHDAAVAALNPTSPQ
jgi:tetratricopeptide (TPR) repeat protein